MKKFIIPAIVCVSAVGGWAAFSIRANASRGLIILEPIHHQPYDASNIDRKIEVNSARVKRDPLGAIGFAMVSEAWLARSRESDSDQAAWKAETAARESLRLRTAGNYRGRVDLVDSLLEQHRFQDALHELEANKARTRQYADVLCEVGKLDEAAAVVSALDKQEEDPSIMATKARIASLKGDYSTSIQLLKRGLALSIGNAGVGETTIAWFRTKLADAFRKAGDASSAREQLDEAIRLFPRSYKAHLALAEMNLEQNKPEMAIEEAKKTLGIANSLDARAVIGDAQMKLGQTAIAEKTYAECRQQFEDEVKMFDRLGKGGQLTVRPIDRQFATFSVKHHMFMDEALIAAERDFKNRPDAIAARNLRALSTNNIAAR